MKPPSYSEIQFLTSGGANAYVDHDQLGHVIQSYTYWADPAWTDAGVAGWYLYDDNDAAYPMNDVVLNPDQATFARRRRVVSTFGLRQMPASRKPAYAGHEMTRKGAFPFS